MKRNTLKVLVVALFLVSVVPYLSARGVNDSETAYRQELSAQVDEVLEQVANGDLDPIQALEQIREFQQSRNRVNEQQLAELTRYMNQLKDGTMTAEQARIRTRSMIMDGTAEQSGDQIMTQNQAENRTGDSSSSVNAGTGLKKK